MAAAAEIFIRSIRHTTDLLDEYISRESATIDNILFLYTTLNEGQPKPEFYNTDKFVENFISGRGFQYLSQLLSKWNEVKSSLFVEIKPTDKISEKLTYGINGEDLTKLRRYNKFKVLKSTYYPHNPNMGIPFKIQIGASGIYTASGAWFPASQQLQTHTIILSLLENIKCIDSIISTKFWRCLYDYVWMGIPKVLWENEDIKDEMIKDDYISDYREADSDNPYHLSLTFRDYQKYIVRLEDELTYIRSLLSSSSSRPDGRPEEDPSLPLTGDKKKGGAAAGGSPEDKSKEIEDYGRIRSISIIHSTKMPLKEYRRIVSSILMEGSSLVFINDKLNVLIKNDFCAYEATSGIKKLGNVIYINEELIIIR